MAGLDGRHKFLAGRLAEAYEVPLDMVEKVLSKRKQEVSSFFEPDGPVVLTWFYQAMAGSASPEPQLFISHVEREPLLNKAVFFVRVNAKGIGEKSVEQDVTAGEISQEALDAYRALLVELYVPILQEQGSWGKSSKDHTANFLQGAQRFSTTLKEAANSLKGSVELKQPEPAIVGNIEAKPTALAKAAADPAVLQHLTDVLLEWCKQTEHLLAESESPAKDAGEDAGPDTELEFWRSRMAKFISVTEQLKGRNCRLVMGVNSAARTKVYKRWRELDVNVTDAANEAKDNVKYLTTLEKSLEPMYMGTPAQIRDSLPTLLNNIKMMHTIARFYNTPERMAVFLQKVTNQMIRNCKEAISAPGKLWDQDKAVLLSNLDAACRLYMGYQEQYRLVVERSQAQPTNGHVFAFDEARIFGKFDLFIKRCRKLINMFTTVHQFSSLAQHTHIDGLDQMTRSFADIVDDIKRKPYDLLDFHKNQFDRDFLEFNVNIHDLETALQGFINKSFDNISSTEHALNLLRQFQSILQRDSLKEDLAAKYQVIFQNYGLDLEAVQKLYETHKNNPPLVRNAPPVAGQIMWARQLFRRIEVPMRRFADNSTLMHSKEAKKIVKVYNRVARALIEFETTWIQAWISSIESAKAGLQATLIVRHSQTGQLLVNLDKQVMQLIREAKALQRMGVAVPESARVVLAQEEKFKIYFSQLTHVLKEHESITKQVMPVVRPLLRPHLEDLENKIQPGAVVLTWTSMNIDGYLHHVKQGLARLAELVHKLTDLLTNRVEANLAAISAMRLVDLVADRSFQYDEFVTVQAKFVKKQAEALAIKNSEVRQAVEDLVELVRHHPRENLGTHIQPDHIELLQQHYSSEMYKAILAAVKNSFSAMKQRLGSRTSAGFLYVERPFFDVSVQLAVPRVAMVPSLQDIQQAINTTAKKVLGCARQLQVWGGAAAPGTTFHDLIARDREVVKMVLLLTGSIEGTKESVLQYIATFNKYSFLWQKELATEYAAFMSNSPSLEAFEAELKKYMAIEQEVAGIAAVHNIGSLSLETQPIKYSLKSEASSWKAQFAKNLHKQVQEDWPPALQGSENLKAFDSYMRDTTLKLNRKVEDLEDVRFLMGILKEVREKEANVDNLINPIEDMYALLMRYQVRVPKEETDMVSDLRYGWRKLRKLSTDVSDTLARLQVGFKRELIKEVKAFVGDAQAFRVDWEANGPMVPGLDPMDAVDRLKKFQQMFEVRKRKWDNYSSGEELFGLPVTRYPELEKTDKEVAMLDRLYGLYVNVITTIRGFGDYFWVDVVEQIDAMTDQVNNFQNQAKKLPKALRDWQAFVDCKKTIDDFQEELPLFQSLAHKSMRPRHWKEVMRVAGKELNLAEDIFKLQHLLDCHLLKHREDVEELCSSAVKEEQIESKLQGISLDWAEQNLSFADYKTRGPVILKASDTAELVEKLEDSQMTLGSMASNRYSAPFREDVNGWIVKLSTVSEIVEQWLIVQNMWMYMEAVFSGGDIVKQLPAEAKRFQNIDKSFMKIVSGAMETKNVVATCFGNDAMKTMLPHLLEQLELCQKSLSAYLETKRAEFPRFYFVSDPTLLEILSLGSDPPSVVPHFQSGLFDSLTSVTFDKLDKGKMLEMFSQQGEKVEFEKPVEAKGMVEVWLQKLVDGMQGTVKATIKRAYRNVQEMALEDFIFSLPAQIALLGIQFQWTGDTQAALAQARTDKSIMSKNMKKTEAILREMVMITLRSELTRIQRTNLETCVTIHMHQKESTEELVKHKIRDPTDFEWLKQARFYWREDRDTVIISVCDVDFEYSYEYLGVKERLVVTPLTDICYVTLSQALGMFLGGAPAGPAGTGKTETTKDLGNTLGKFVVVFNCSDQMDYKGMGKIYKGLAQSGLWGCFDEFNRINLDVLSVCAQQVYCVLSAIRERKRQFVFTDGSTVSLDPRVGFFITMNPGYAGRQELPENLKALFRGVTMMVPNRQIIMKVKLAACGFQENDLLSKKFFVLYGLCEQQLSKQAHYDFGLRNILSVLRTAGAAKRANPDKSEVFLMMRCLRDMNMSKFVAEDVPLFLSLIDDLFPGLKAERASFPEISAALEKVVLERGLQLHPNWLNKCIQLYETYLVRHGIMLVGPAGSGKSAICECLAAALTELGTKHVIWRMNPKAITAPQMFGRMDAATGDWTDGVFAVLWRRAAKNKNQNTWIVLDGPVDAIWIENLNTVLDDNKVLTLANGDRILMTPQMKAMFEPENLSNASPATVSRAGIIYVSDSELGWGPAVASWLQTRRPAEAAALKPCFDRIVEHMLDFIRVNLRPVMYNEAVCQVGTVVTLLNGCLLKSVKDNTTLDAAHYERLFLYCVAWGLGGLLEVKDRPAFDAELRTLTKDLPPKGDEGDTVFEFLVRDDTAKWQHWRECVPSWEYPRKQERPKFAQLVIPTLDSVRYEKLLQLCYSVQKGALLVGGSGTAKTTIINQFLSRFNPEEASSKTITFSYLTTPQIFQQSVEGCVEKRQGRTFGPPGGKIMSVFIDDISMPAINDWGDQVTNEIVRQLLEQGGMYSLEKPIGDMKFLVDCRYMAAMNQPGGGKNDIPNRLKRQFAIFNVPLPSTAAINNIFGALVKGRFDAETFASDVCEVAKKLVPLTVTLWNRVSAKMLPTPAKFHYLFNMRELSKVFQGVILASRDRFQKNSPLGAQLPPFGGSVTSPEAYLLALWVHECQRVFSDKMITLDDKAWVDGAIKELCKQNFVPDLIKQVEEPLYFVDFLREPITDSETGEVIEAHPSYYESVAGGLSDIRRRAEALQRKFNEESKAVKLELVLFTDALMHLMRISRLFAMDRGSALLVGVGGSGKQSLSRLAAYIAGAYPFQITITKTYNFTNLFEDIKALYKIAGLKGQPVAFIFSDSEVKEEGFLEYINQILMTGEVAGLFPKDELDIIVNDIRPIMKAEAPGVLDTWDNLYSFFLERVRNKLHICLCFSPVGIKFSRRAQQFPGLINGCTIDWFLSWPEEALTSVSGKFIDEFSMACPDIVKDSLKLMMGAVHVNVTAACQEYFEKFRRHVYVTPKSYLSFISGYKALYQKKLNYVRELATSINSGLAKMGEAKVDVNKMKGELAVKNTELAAATREAEKLLKEISENTAIAEKEKQKVVVIVDAVTQKASEIAAVKDDAEKDLAAAKPALDSALAALGSITPKDIVSLKALKNPPDIVKRIFDCVLLLRYMSVQKAQWQDVKGSQVLMGTYEESVKMMGDSQFLNALMNFPKEQITDETVELLLPYFRAPDFNFDSAKKASGNVAGLCNWAEAMCTYHVVAKVVEPKIATLRAAEAELKTATREKNAAEERMAIVQSKLDEMQASFDAAMAQKQMLEDDATATQRKMDSANALINALAGEEARWTQQSKEFDDTIQRLTGDCAIASSFVSYLGPFNKEFRELLITRDFYGGCIKLNIPVTKDMQVTKFLVDDAEIGEWTLQGLPGDDLSTQNGIMVTRATRYPVLVDPQGQGRTWLMHREEANQLKVTQLNDKMFRNHLEDCLSFGKPLLIENIEEELDPVLDPVLERRYVKKGRGFTVALADKEVDYTDTFKLFCTTRLPNPHYTPELSAKVTLVDFTVTTAGLEDQLLGKLILKEKHELEEQRQALMEEVQSYRKKIRQLEDDLLFRLSNSQGNLLDDTELIDVLAVTKQTAGEVNERLLNASETNKKINEACEEYRPVAHRATLIYFLIAEYNVVNCMYQTSLSQFNQLYELAIDRSERAALPSKRINNIIDYMTYEIYLYIQRGLFERHKIIFALMLTNKVLASAGKVKAEDIDTFLKGAGALDISSVRKKPKEWIPDGVWLNIVALSGMEALRDIPDSVFRNDGLWRQWYDAEAPETAHVPDYEERLTKFERMCVVKAFREDRTLIAAADYIAEALGQRFVESVPLNMERAWSESHPKCPLICLLSPGADPTKLIEDLAKKKKIKTLGVSMGQGQEIIARKYMASATIEGQWVLLQNTHLGLGYLTEVEQFLVKAEEIHEDFRLWITAEPHPSFPIGLLQMGIKITNEAPVGMKAGLRASYQWVNQDMLDAVNRPDWRQLLFIMCFLHSIVQERRKFGPIGWNVPYEFNQSDLSACVQFLQNHLLEVDAKKAAGPTWETVRYMVAEIQYGGRITDDFDQLLFITYAEKYFHPSVTTPRYELYRDAAGFGYAVPEGSEIELFRKAIEELPGQESPEIFGLHPNADLTFRTLQVQAAVQIIVDTRPKGGGGGGGLSREEVVDRICEDLLSKVPAMFDKEDTKEKLKRLPGGPTQPLTVHLRQELDRLNIVLKLTSTTLKNLRLAIAGTIALSGDLIDSLDALYNARIPQTWLKKSWEASTLGNWFLGLLQRFDQLNKWLTGGRPKAYWMTGFFNPQGFLTAMKQEVNRKHAGDKWALDDVVMTSDVTYPPREVEALKEAPAEGVYIYGLFLDGCAWSGKENRLVDSEPKKLFHPLPVLFVTGVLAKDRKKVGIYEAPTYRVKKRTGLNFITTFPLRTEDPAAKWILRGVALLCSID